MIPNQVNKLITVSKKVIGNNQKSDTKSNPEDYYAAIHAFSELIKYDVVEDLLAALGDTKFIDLYHESYGKQKLSEFQNGILEALFDSSERGDINEEITPVDNSYCVLDFFSELLSGDNYIEVLNPEFTYKRISAKSVDKIELTEEEKLQLAKAKTKKDLDHIIDLAVDRSVKVEIINKGYSVSNFVWNEERANLSALIKIDVTLNLPKNDYGIDKVDTFVFRNFTIIKDGILNINSLPIIIDKDTFEKFKDNSKLKLTDVEVLDEQEILGDAQYKCIVDISELPIINTRRVRSSKKKTMTKLALQLMDCKFQLKYLGYLKRELSKSPKTPKTNLPYTTEQWNYLNSLGISLNGYSPKRELDKSGEQYSSLALTSNFKGFSSIPIIESVIRKVHINKKLTQSENYLWLVMTSINNKYLDKDIEVSKKNVYKAFNEITNKKRSIAEKLSQMKFAMIISRKWFSDCESFDDNLDTIISDYGPELTIEYRFVNKNQYL